MRQGRLLPFRPGSQLVPTCSDARELLGYRRGVIQGRQGFQISEQGVAFRPHGLLVRRRRNLGLMRATLFLISPQKAIT